MFYSKQPDDLVKYFSTTSLASSSNRRITVDVPTIWNNSYPFFIAPERQKSFLSLSLSLSRFHNNTRTIQPSANRSHPPFLPSKAVVRFSSPFPRSLSFRLSPIFLSCPPLFLSVSISPSSFLNQNRSIFRFSY